MDNSNLYAYEGEYEVGMGVDQYGNQESIFFRDETLEHHYKITQKNHLDPDGRDVWSGPKMQSLRDKCCAKCQQMTGTLDGLHALVRDGYRHYNYHQLSKVAKMGCPLCRLITRL
jgi:hypothetical protein